MTPTQKSVTGLLVYFLFVARLSTHPLESRWPVAMLMLVPMVLAPLAFELAEPHTFPSTARTLLQLAQRTQLLAALLLGVGFLSSPGPIAAALSVPWLGVTALVAIAALMRMRDAGFSPIDRTYRDAALMFLLVGGAWTFADRLGMRPLNFDPAIVRLTAVHFHYAGFLLPLFTGLAMREAPGRAVHGRTAQLAGLAVIAGVPATAIGITVSQTHGAPMLETGAALLMAPGGFLSAWLHLTFVRERRHGAATRALFLLASCSLAIGMMFATGYALRRMMVVPWLTIPWMQAVHGTVNAIGFGVGGTMAWWIQRKTAGKSLALSGRGYNRIAPRRPVAPLPFVGRTGVRTH